MSAIPLVDLSDTDAAERFLDACTDVGFVSVIGHEIDPALFDRMRRLTADLFALDENAKVAGAITRDNYRGFIPLGFFTPNRVEANGDRGDRYEGYKLHWECPTDHPVRDECALYGSNRWVDALPEMERTVLAYWSACDALATRLMTIVSQGLGLDPDEVGRWFSEPLTNMTLLHYPAQEPTDPAIGIHPHKDTNVLTFLHPDPVGGLEVRDRSGEWIDVVAPPEALVVNIGEMLELWSGGRFVATPHRVVNRSGHERYSFPYFTVPRHDVVVEPLGPCQPGFEATTMPVGPLSAEVWRTNWPDEHPSDAGFDLGTLPD